MARVTVEDCIEKITNRFDLVLVAAQRARAIHSGDPLTLDRDNDKNPVVALREIADETIAIDAVQSDLINSLQRMKKREEEIAARDAAASLAQDDMSAFTGDNILGGEADAAGLQIAAGDDLAAAEASPDSPFAPDIDDDDDLMDDGASSDDGSFADEGADAEDGE